MSQTQGAIQAFLDVISSNKKNQGLVETVFSLLVGTVKNSSFKISKQLKSTEKEEGYIIEDNVRSDLIAFCLQQLDDLRDRAVIVTHCLKLLYYVASGFKPFALDGMMFYSSIVDVSSSRSAFNTCCN